VSRPPQEHPSLTHRCPFCGADPGTPCLTHRGRELDWPHARRIQLVDPAPVLPNRRALCCHCGNLRTFKEARNERGWFGDNAAWHREIADMKCDACRAIMPHALLAQDNASWRDVDEMQQRVALGGDLPKGWHWDVSRIREYRAKLPRNPKLHHFFSVADADEARARGETRIPALCGDIAEIPGEWSRGTCDDDIVEPQEVQWDTEFEDPETGLWWLDMDCVNCLSITNARRRCWRHKAVNREINELLKTADAATWDLEESEIVRDALRRIVNNRQRSSGCEE
jgi:hypothetical protein